MILFYIDPGTGSMLFQAVIAGFLGFIMFFKQIKIKIINFLKKKNNSESE